MKEEIILIIDDDASIRDGCNQTLKREGYTVFTAAQGAQGIKTAREVRPCMAFIDLKMPGIPGDEVLNIISEDIPDIVLVVITGYASIISAVESMKKGAYDYLPKPFTPDQLRAVTRRGLEHRGLRIQARKLKEERDRMERGFITFVSHEMRSPLVTVQQYMEALKAVAGDSLGDDVLDIAQRSSKRIQGLQDMIEHWLDISRIGGDSFLKDRASLDLSSIMHNSIEEMRLLCEKRGISVTYDTHDSLPAVMGDEASILRVFVNIIGNASKYTPREGRISIRDEYDDYYVSMHISDTGSGIPEDHLAFLFEPFYQVKGRQQEYRGSGLGLTFCKRIMDAHKGRIEASSEQGKGTTFSLRFPR
ncbi:MAG: ATP-binding protein [Thermodesulfobacteriota bacterium]|nr:ATP-binding protein [Thermodesulfobacteriota bacterium]